MEDVVEEEAAAAEAENVGPLVIRKYLVSLGDTDSWFMGPAMHGSSATVFAIIRTKYVAKFSERNLKCSIS